MPRLEKYDYLAGAAIMLFGAVAVVCGIDYHVGTLSRMGPGFFPVALGVVLILAGIVIAYSKKEEDGEDVPLDWRGMSCIVLGVVLFIVLGAYAGLIPATAACVFVSAMGDRTATIRSSLLLSVAITCAGVLLFSYALGVPFPLFR
ncbi:MAG: tripartite tricarboxylate transporter TctB family protein [Rhizobiales bacterium]|nr:tripartite tricarboxylate transporter TctB family protein [Hyphomicrobiales bacterium]